METIVRRIRTLRRLPLREGARLVFRKAVYRRVQLRRYGILAGDSVGPRRRLQLTCEFLREDAYDEVLGTTPYLSPADLEHFHRQESVCIVVRDG